MPFSDDYKQLIESFAETVWETDASGMVRTDSPSWRAYTGQTPEQSANGGWQESIHPEDRPNTIRVLEEARRTQQKLKMQHRIRRYDGQYRWFQVRQVPIKDENGVLVRWLGAAIEINDQQVTLEAMQQSEERLKKALSIETVGVLFFNPEGVILHANEAFQRMSGYSDDDFKKGRIGWHHLTPPEFVKASQQSQDELRTGGQSRPYEKQYIRPDGGRWWGLFAAKRLSDDECVEFVIDITKSKEAEAHINEVLESIDNVFYAVDQDFRFTYLNHKAEETWGRQRDELLGRSIWEAFPQAVGSEAYQMHLRAMSERQSVYFETFSPIINRWISVSLFPLSTGGLSVFFHDITEARQAQDALRHSEERFRTLVQNIRDYAIFMTDQHGIITEWTEGAQRVKGYTPEEVIGQSIAVCYPPEAVAAGEPEKELQETARAGRIEREGVRVRKGGERFWVDEIATAIYDGQGQLVGFTKISRDITRRKRAQELRRQLEQRAKLAVEAAQMATWEWDLVADQVYWNEKHFQLLGMPVLHTPLKSAVFLNHTHPDDRQRITDMLTQAIREQGLYDADFRIIRDDNKRVCWMSGYGRVTEVVKERPTRMSGLMFDISERKWAEEALKEADRRKDEFLAMLAHELRNPMATLRNGLNILNLTAAEDQVMNATVDKMNWQTDHLVRLVDDLLDVSRISQGKIELRRQRLDLTDLVRQAVEASRPLYEEHHRQLSLSLPSFPLYLDGDATRLTQVVTNLLTNGLRYTREAGGVWVTLEPVDGEALLRVRDNGIGLAPDQLPVIFDLFVQVDHSLARAGGGLGLGLTLVRQLVEMHGGRVEAQSPGLGQGSEFRVYLPVVPVAKTAPFPPNGASRSATTFPRILVVDDNQDAAQTLSMLLKIKKYDIHTCYSGQEALAIAGSLEPQVIILDINMPGLDGYQTCRLIRQQPWGESMVLIALTGYGQQEDRRRAKEAGFDGHLVKPVDMIDLIDLLNRLSPGTT